MSIIGPNMSPITAFTGAQSAKGPNTADSEPLPQEKFIPSATPAPEKAAVISAAPAPTPPAAPPLAGAVLGAQIGAQIGAQGGVAFAELGKTLVDLSSEAPKTEHSNLDGFLAKLANATPIATIQATDVPWDKGAEVVSNAQKFVIPVPKFEGEALVYPEGAKDKDGKSIAGNPICDWQGQPIGDKGVVFFNPKDQAWQAVKSDGEGVVIMNQITEPQGKKLMEKIASLTGGDPAKLSIDQFKDVLSFASSEIGWEKPDMYNSDRGFISKKMNPLESQSTGIAQYGLFRRDDRDVCRALLAEGPAEFQAPTSGGVMVKQPITEEGGVLVRQPDGKVFLYRKIDIEAMEETYTHKDGRGLKVSELPKYEPA